MVVAWLLPVINYPLTPERAVAFIIALILGLGLSIAMSAAVAMIAFWSTQARNLYGLWIGVGQFLSGWIAPLALFPPATRNVAVWLPFRSTLGLPTEILMGRLSTGETLFGMTVAAGWIVAFGFLYRLLWARGLRRYEAVGG